jgi:uncharacterized protein (DUF2164 family)
MQTKTPPISYLSEAERKVAVEKIQSFFLDERDEEIGFVAADDLFSFIETEIAPQIYNRAIDDCRTKLKEQLAEVDFVMSELKK